MAAVRPTAFEADAQDGDMLESAREHIARLEPLMTVSLWRGKRSLAIDLPEHLGAPRIRQFPLPLPQDR
jgi:hypothetical protein